jgi:endonuclease/exonuclease/phosphatase family metal-dependent hydrolase
LPERLDPTRIESFGPAVLSKLPLRSARVLDLVAGQQPVIELELELPDQAGALHVAVAHPARPGRAARTAQRNASLRALAERVDFGPRSVLLADLNCTLYSPAFGDLCARTGLRSARHGHGRMPSWRSQRWVPGLWLDLDHALVGDALEVADFRTGAGFGSDHLPIVARVRVPREPLAWRRAPRPLHAAPQTLLPDPR